MDDSELHAVLIEEAREHLSDLETRLLEIKSPHSHDADVSVQAGLRVIGSLQDVASSLGLRQISEVACRLEKILTRYRDKTLLPDSLSVNVMLAAGDHLKEVIDCVETGDDIDGSVVCRRLDAILLQSSADQLTPTSRRGSAAQPKTPAPKGRSTIERKPPVQRKPSPRKIDFVTDRVIDSLDRVDSHVGDVLMGCDVPPAPIPSGVAPDHQGSTGRIGSKVCVNAAMLDRLTLLAGELATNRDQWMALLSDGTLPNAIDSCSADARGSLPAIAGQLNRVADELHDTIAQVRMQPIENLFARLKNEVRDLGVALGKTIELKTQGGEVEVDNAILQTLADPLTHLVRNACVHGVESSATRQAIGKPAVGTVSLCGYQDAGSLTVEVADDGAGFDPDVLQANAVGRLHNAMKIDVVSAIGTGTTVRVTVPLTLRKGETAS
ncbi:Hpt domain-containing protein [Aporhodopirellula aestuarii]|uniref:Hpt domain-containing protein n=1 Tax=Aporhodopirellula aestuarii TaxID=2950107 RepID=A0ABT0UEE6_9BACT|nr:Hpt domain-containing protein [Aporhodopirellula aestuarii]MCM2374738.1 Hpt domain-containing protein [Aporhodopirellula aestuarii]